MSELVPVMFPRRSRLRAVLYVAAFALDVLFGWPAVLIIHWTAGVKGALRWEDGVLRTKYRKDTWIGRSAKKRRFGALTLSPHALIYDAAYRLWPEDLKAPAPIQHHEHTHVEQGEAASLAGAIDAVILAVLGLVVLVTSDAWVAAVLFALAFLTWLLAHLQCGLAARWTAQLRGEKAYEGSHVEEAAYARADESRR